MMDMSTQTDDLPPPPKKTPPKLPPRNSIARTPTPPMEDIPETKVVEATPPSKKVAEEKPDATLKDEPKVTPKQEDSKALEDADDADSEDDDDDVFEEEPVVIHEVHQAAAPQVITRARVVQVAKPIPPQLPARNPFRNRVSTASIGSNETSHDAATGPSSAVEKQSPISTPSLRHGDSTSSLSSVEGASLERITNTLQPKPSTEPAPEPVKKDEKEDAFQSLPESPIKTVPGSFQ
jgi:hypothetical protein